MQRDVQRRGKRFAFGRRQERAQPDLTLARSNEHAATITQHLGPHGIQHPMRLLALRADAGHMHAMRADPDVFHRSCGSVIPAKGKPKRQHIQPEKTGHRKRALQHEHHGHNKIDHDHHDQHPAEGRKTEAPVWSKLSVHVERALERGRRGRAFPLRRHGPKASAYRANAKDIAHVSRRLTKTKAEQLYARLADIRPDPRTELEYTNPYTLLVAVVLSAQATDKGVNRATKGLFPLADTPQKMLKLGEEGLAKHIQTIGLWRNKTKNVVALSRALIDHHNGQVPREREALEALPGVGRKTANVVLMEIFGEGTIAVDTHVFRVANRTGLAAGKTPAEVEAQLMRITPKQYLHGAHHWLILHGRYTCLARRPDCPRCVIRDICLYSAKTPPAAAKPSPRKVLRGAKRKA